MSDAYDDFSQILSALTQTLDDLDSNVKNSLAEWDGQAREAFDQAHQIWRRSAADMAQQLAGLRRAIAVAHANYSQCETANLAMFSLERR